MILPQSIFARCTASFSKETGELTMTSSGTDSYVNEARTMNGLVHQSQNGKLYAVPNEKQKVYFKSFNGVFDKSYVSFYDRDKKQISFARLNVTGIGGIDIPAGTKYLSLRIGIGESVSGTVYKDKIALSFDQITEWTKPFYDGKSVCVKLRSLSNGTCDEYLSNGKILRRVGYTKFDGSSDEIWYKRSDGMGFTIQIADAINDNSAHVVMCNRGIFDGGTSKNQDTVVLGGSRNFSYFTTSITAIDEWRTWLSTHPLDVIYPLDIQTTETIDIPILKTKAPKANVFIQTSLDTDIEWEILTASSNDLQVEELKKRIEALESALIGE